jgi:hypothetical protein
LRGASAPFDMSPFVSVCSLLHTSVIFEIHTRRIYCEQLPRNFADLHKILFKLIDFVCAVESDKAKNDEDIKIEEKSELT